MKTVKYLWPPRTNIKATFGDESMMLWMRYPDVIAQPKLNGTRVVVYINDDVVIWNRHRARLQYALPLFMKKEILSKFGGTETTVLDGELLHTKTKEENNVLVFFDVLRGQGVDKLSYMRRYEFITSLAKLGLSQPPKAGVYQMPIIDRDEWESVYMLSDRHKWLEGLMLKRTNALSQLDSMDHEHDTYWMMKVRRATKNYLV